MVLALRDICDAFFSFHLFTFIIILHATLSLLFYSYHFTSSYYYDLTTISKLLISANKPYYYLSFNIILLLFIIIIITTALIIIILIFIYRASSERRSVLRSTNKNHSCTPLLFFAFFFAGTMSDVNIIDSVNSFDISSTTGRLFLTAMRNRKLKVIRRLQEIKTPLAKFQSTGWLDQVMRMSTVLRKY